MNALAARLVAGLLDCLHDQFEGLGVAFQIGGEPAFVADVGRILFVVQHFFQIMEHLAAAADGVAEAVETQRHDHELLHVHGVVGVRAAVDDVHHRGGQQPGADATQVTVQRQAAVTCRRMCTGQRHAQDGVRAEFLLVLGAVEFDHPLVQADLIERVEAAQFVGDFRVHVVNRRQNPFTEVFRFVAVAKFEGLVDTGAGPAGHRRPAERAVGQIDIDLDGRISTAIENLSGTNVYNR